MPTPADLERLKAEHQKRQEQEHKQRQNVLDIATPQSNPSMFKKFSPITEKRMDG